MEAGGAKSHIGGGSLNPPADNCHNDKGKFSLAEAGWLLVATVKCHFHSLKILHFNFEQDTTS